MILAAGLTPARQQILEFERFAAGEVNRAASAHWCASGKVLNVGLALHALGAKQTTLCLTGGPHGRAIRDEFAQSAVHARWVESETPTRVCTTILDRATGRTTELVENSRPVTDAELAAFRHTFAEEAATSRLIILSGSLPAGAPTEFYQALLEASSNPSILDIRGPELLAALPCRPLLVKPNREELERTIGRSIEDDGALLSAMADLNDSGARWVLITDGGGSVWLRSNNETLRFTPPQVDVVNPIGCGDCLAAGLAAAIHDGANVPEAARFGIAAAVDNVGRVLPSRLDRERIDRIVPSVDVERV